VAITRQDLGEFLIARVGAQRLDFLVNHKIIEQECIKRNIYVSDAEVEAQLIEDLKGMKVPDLKTFVNSVLKRFQKTLFEYKEDVIRPRLALRKLYEGTIQVSPRDIQDAFEAKYGPKVSVRVIVLGNEMQESQRQKVWQDVRKDEKAFMEYARDHNVAALAPTAGLVPPIHKHFGDATMERVAFSLKKGQVSELFQITDKSWLIFRCEDIVAPDLSHQLAVESLVLQREVFERKLAEEVPKRFAELRQVAGPKVLLEKDTLDQKLVYRVDHTLRASAIEQSRAMLKPPPGIQGN
jgi:hypothetical protein